MKKKKITSSAKPRRRPRAAKKDNTGARAAKSKKSRHTSARVKLLPAFPIVGIGASAGGLATFKDFFSSLPAHENPGVAFVIIQHLAPDQKSILVELVQRFTRLPVSEAKTGMAVMPNEVYIVPPNNELALRHCKLYLTGPASAQERQHAIDYFFRSLAEDQHDRAIGIVLSGTGSDGTLGLRAIKAEGGMLMAQSPETAEYDGMPKAAIATGLVDYVLPPAAMLPRLITFVSHRNRTGASPAVARGAFSDSDLKTIFSLLQAQTGYDFSQYKMNTIVRRLARRLAINEIKQIGEYLRYLKKNPAEVEMLFRDMLIGVTNFFRDPEVFAAVQNEVVPRLFSGKTQDDTVRIWVCGCSTGEEAYSIAMLLQEYMESHKLKFKVQIFATDIDDRAISRARAGIYAARISADVPPARLARFFYDESSGGEYHIVKSIRDMVVFSVHDVTSDPPFSKLDLISCRNLLIYLDVNLQKKIIPLFHYALNPGGQLLLGPSESAGDFTELFKVSDRKAKIYRRKEVSSSRKISGTRHERFLPPARLQTGITRHETPDKVTFRELTERALLQHIAATAVLVNEQGEILYLYGRSGQYLEPAPGEAGLSIYLMAREGLRHELTVVLHKVISSHVAVQRSGVRVRTNGNFTAIDLTVSPMAQKHAGQNMFLVVIERARENPEPDLPVVTKVRGSKAAERRIAALTREIRAKEDYLQSTLEEMRSARQGFQSANEEMQSINEEMQSTNEELETSKEELQSVNEELATVNAELQSKNAELSQANNDMNNFLSATEIGTIFIDHKLLIQRFTPAVTDVVNLIAADVGRPLTHISSNLIGYDRLIGDVSEVLDNLVPCEREVQSRAGEWYLLRILPYRTAENAVNGAVIIFINITELKRAKDELQESHALARLAAVVRDTRDAVTTIDTAGNILAWNPAAERLYGYTQSEALGMNVRALLPAESQATAASLLQAYSESDSLQPLRMQRMKKSGETITVSVIAAPLVNAAGEIYAIATTERMP